MLLASCHMQFVVHNIPFVVADVDFSSLGPRVGSLGPILVPVCWWELWYVGGTLIVVGGGGAPGIMPYAVGGA